MAKKKTFSFAHLIGLGPSASEEEEDKKAKKAKGRRAEEEEEEETAEEEEEETAEEEEEEETASEEDDPEAEEDEDGDDPKESKSARQARSAERKRCARIFGSKHAAANPSLAASLAFNTGMSSAAAINVLASTAPASQSAATRKRSLDQRMHESHQVRLNPDGAKPTGKSALVSQMTSLYNSAKGEK